MAHDDVRLELAREWLTKAQDDEQAASLALGTEPKLLEISMFHSQQCAEKSLKGFLLWHEQRFGKIHNIAILVSSCENIDPEFASLAPAAELSDYAVDFRYPGHLPPTSEQADEASRLARLVFEMVAAKLPTTVHEQEIPE
jgi:HEPN domain-containing protein